MAQGGEGLVDGPPPLYVEEWEGEAPARPYPQPYQSAFYQAEDLPVVDQIEHLRASLYASDKYLNERVEFSDRKNERDHANLFGRLGQLEDAVGPALGSADTLVALVAEGEARVKVQGDVAVDSLFAETDLALERLEGKVLAGEEKISERVSKEFQKQVQLMEIQVQRALDKRGLESLSEISEVIKNELKAEVPKVFVQVQNLFTEDPNALLTSRFKEEVFALVEEKSAHFGRDIGSGVEEMKVELYSEIEALKAERRGDAQQRQALEQRVSVLSQRPPPVHRPPTPFCSRSPPS